MQNTVHAYCENKNGLGVKMDAEHPNGENNMI